VLFVGASAHKLGTGAEGFAYLLAGLGVGGILAAGAVDRLAGARRLGVIILAGAIGYCLPTALLVVLHSPILAFIVEMIRGAATLIVDVLAITALQRATPADQLARVFGVFFASVLGAIALGTVLTPTVVSAGGLDAGLWVMALAPAALAVAGYPALKAVDRQTAQRAAELEPRVALLEGLGIFAAASRPILERLASVAVPAAFAAGTAIVAEGEESDALYVLTGGQVQVSARGEVEGAPRVPRTMIAPAYFGEIGVLERIPRTATVAAEGSVHGVRWQRRSPPESALRDRGGGVRVCRECGRTRSRQTTVDWAARGTRTRCPSRLTARGRTRAWPWSRGHARSSQKRV